MVAPLLSSRRSYCAPSKRVNHRRKRDFWSTTSFRVVVFSVTFLFVPVLVVLNEEKKFWDDRIVPKSDSTSTASHEERASGQTMLRKNDTKTWASPEDRLLDPAHSNRVERISDMTSFPMPKFHGCVEGKFCTFSNVCYSHRKGMLIFDVPDNQLDPNNPKSEWYPFFRDPKTVRERAPVIVPSEQYSKFTNVYRVPGETLVIDCHCQQALESNPAHFLQGHGNLFGAASGFYASDDYFGTDSGSQPIFDMVLYHHCSLTTDVWPWGKFVDGLIWDAALNAGTVSVEKENIDDARVFLPVNWDKSERVDPDDIVVCGETVRQEPYTLGLYFGNYLGGNDPKRLALKWRDWTAQKLNLTERDHQSTQALPSSTAADTTDSAFDSCVRNLRIATWRRTEGVALRRLVNLEDIKDLVAEYTTRPISILSANSQTSPEEHISIFRSFDIMITTHGSQMANQIFSPYETVFIEVAVAYSDECLQLNGWQFLTKYIMSYGHSPHNNEELTSKIPFCQEHDFGLDPNSTCPVGIREQLKNTDIVANLTILRENLKEAFSALCDG